MTNNPTLKNAQNPRLILLLMIMILLGPLIFAYILVKKRDVHQFRMNNHGTLISPVKDISALKAFESLKIQGKWWLVYIGPEECKNACEDIAYNMRQIKTALGKDQDRLNNLYIVHPACRQSECEKGIQKDYKDMRKIKMSKLEHNLYFNDVSNSLYVIDPQGNLMMHFDTELPAKDILADLKRLLKVSQNG